MNENESFNSRVKIAFIGPLPPPLGGVAATNRNIQKLLNQNYVLDVFNTSGGKDREDLYSHKGLKEACSQIKIIINGMYFLIKTESKIVNVFVTSNISFIREMLFIFVARLLRKRVVIHLHSKLSGELFLGKHMIKAYCAVLGLGATVFVLSEKHKHHFSKFIKQSKLVVLENFVFVDNFSPCEKRTDVQFLYVGRLTKQKGILDLIQACAVAKNTVPHLKVHLIGLAETTSAEKEIQEMIENNALRKNIILHGALDGEEKYGLFHQCSIFLFPSHFENSPVVLKEALAAEQIIVCSNIDANLNIVRGNEQSYIFIHKAESVASLADSMVAAYQKGYATIAIERDIKCPEKATSKYCLNILNTVYKAVYES